MIDRTVLPAFLLLMPCVLAPASAVAQDVPGIEICTVEKTMERRTSCLQSNVDFLIKTITKLGADHQQKLDAANRQIEGLKSTIIGLQKSDRGIAVGAEKRQRAKSGAACKRRCIAERRREMKCCAGRGRRERAAFTSSDCADSFPPCLMAGLF